MVNKVKLQILAIIKAKLFLLAIFVLWTWLALAFLPFTLVITLYPLITKNQNAIRYRLYYWLAMDQFLNALFFGNPDVTISSRVGWLAANGSATARFAEIIIDKIFYIAVGQSNHCRNSFESNEKHYEVNL